MLLYGRVNNFARLNREIDRYNNLNLVCLLKFTESKLVDFYKSQHVSWTNEYI